MSERLVFHIDVNSAFLSWEAARRVSAGQEDLRLIPSAIGGDRDKRTGVILAKSIPAKKYGVKTGEPVGMALKKCPQLYLARPDFRLYEKCSHAFTPDTHNMRLGLNASSNKPPNKLTRPKRGNTPR